MGAAQSSESKKKNLSQSIDYIAANYILTSKFEDFKNLTNPKYCNNLVILTSDVINRYLNTQEVAYLKQRLEGSVEINEMAKGNIAFFKKDNMDKMDIKSPLIKKRMCIAIAKFYVQIFHVFNAIAHTINPVYTWKDQTGSTVTVDYEHRGDIPKNVNPTISKINLCSSRINALVNKQSTDISSNQTEVQIKPAFCSLNKGKDGKTENLQQEPGIPELETLYYDEYDYSTGVFKSMSKDMKTQYDADVTEFYKVFTGKDNKPANITTFSDITLRDFHNISHCKPGGAFTKGYTGPSKHKLFGLYAENIKEMDNATKKNQDSLLKLVDQLFVFIKDPQDPKNKLIIINPKLNTVLLTRIIGESRKRIISLYSDCEKYFFKGLQIFEAIVEKQIMDTSISQVKRLEKNIENVMVSQVAPQAPIAPAPESVEEPKEEPAEEPRQEPAQEPTSAPVHELEEEQTQEPSPAPAQSPVKQNSNEKSSI